MEDPRPAPREVAGDLRVGDGVDVGPQTEVVERDTAALELAGEVPGAGLVLVQHEELDVPATRAEVGKELEEVRLRAGDARHLLHVQDEAVPAHVSPATTRTPRAHDSTECPAWTRARRRRPTSARASASSAAKRTDPVGELVRVVAREPLCHVEEAVEDRVRREHREAARTRFVDDLVRGSGTHVVHQRVVGREEGRKVGSGHGVFEPDTPAEVEPLDEAGELLAVRLFLG